MTSRLPTVAGVYYWSEWSSFVTVVQSGKHLYVTPPGVASIPVRITPRIAGKFTRKT